MRLPFVSRLAFDVLQQRAEAAEARHDALLEKYHALRAAGAVPTRPTLPAPTLPAPDPELRAVQEASATFVAQAEADFRALGKSPEEARALAAHIRDAVVARDVLPSFP